MLASEALTSRSAVRASDVATEAPMSWMLARASVTHTAMRRLVAAAAAHLWGTSLPGGAAPPRGSDVRMPYSRLCRESSKEPLAVCRGVAARFPGATKKG